MGKLTAYLAGVSLSLVMVYYYLSTFYSPLVQWVSPYFGPNVPIIMGIAFLYLGNPLHWPVLIASWTLVGIVVGIGARKGTRAVGAAILVYYTVAGFLALALFSLLFESIGGLSPGNFSGFTSLSTLASGSLSPPPGTNLYTILTEPLMGRMLSVISILSGSLALGGLTVNPAIALPISTGGIPYSSFVYRIIFIFLPSLIANFVLFLVVSGIVGWYLNRKINPRGSKGRKNRGKAVITAVSIIAVMILVSVLASSGNFSGDTHTGINGQEISHYEIAAYSSMFSKTPLAYLYSDHGSSPLTANTSQVSALNYAAAVVGRYGDIYNIFSYAGRQNGIPPSGWAGVARNYSSVFTIIAFSSNISRMVSSMERDSLFGLSSSFSSTSAIGAEFNRYLNLIPGVTIVEDFIGNYSSTLPQASNESSLISKSMNLSGVSLLSSFTLPPGYISNISVTSTLYLYGAGIATYQSQYAALQTISGYLPESGTFGIFSDGLGNGYLVPGATPSSVNSSLMIVGYLNSREIENLISGTVGSGNLSSLLGNGVYLSGGIFQKSSEFFSPPYRFHITASQMLNSGSQFTFPSDTTVYGLTLAVPQELSSGNETYIYHSYSNANNISIPVSGFGSYTHVNSTSVINPSLLSLNTTQVFPARLSIEISTERINSTTVEINTTMHTFNGTVLSNFTISEYGLIASYPGIATLVDGKTNYTTPYIGSRLVNYSYVVRFRNPGTYVMPNPLVSYTLNGSSFSYGYSDPVIVVPMPDVLSTLNAMEYQSAMLLSGFTGSKILVEEIFPGLYFFDLIPIALVLVDIPLEYFWFRRVLRRRRKARSGKP